ncbi:MAG: hypothetical protein ACTSU7_00155 [Candidatus Heimdallarchaeaceae archaeon]
MKITTFKYKQTKKTIIGRILIYAGVVTSPLPTLSPLWIGLGLALASPLSVGCVTLNALSDLNALSHKAYYKTAHKIGSLLI